MITANDNSRFKLILLPVLVVLLLFSLQGTTAAQGTPGGGGGNGGGNGGPFDPGEFDGTNPNPFQDQGFDPTAQQDQAGGTGTGGGGGADTGDGELEQVEPFRLNFEIEDLRNQGFVGPTAEVINAQGFVGPPSESTQLPLGEDRSIGGTINAGRGSRTATTSSRVLQENGFTVQRQGIRSRLRPAFAAPKTPGYVAESRFQSRMVRQPVVRTMGLGITVTVNNRTAVLTGTVGSEAERQIIKRQLRLEPGVYGIDDRTSIAR
jgi:hypothetical protein